MQGKQGYRSVFAVALLAAFFLMLCLPVAAAETEQPSLNEASAVYFYHLESGRLMIEKNADTVNIVVYSAPHKLNKMKSL